MRQDRSLGLAELRFLVAATGEKPVEERIEAEQGRQQQHATIKIPNVGGTHQRARQQAQPVDDDMTLFAIDLLSSVITAWIDVTPIFSYPSRPAC